MYRLDTELLARIVEFPSAQGHGKTRVNWGVGIQAFNFYGIDINPFAVALAKVTLNIAKKIAFDERREIAADLTGQVELEVDPSLPLDNLDKNIVCADALFTDWPVADAIVGNPPILGDRKIRAQLGADYIRRLRETSGVDGLVDLSCYWFRRAHDRLLPGGRAGLVGTSGVRVGKAREASLDYVVTNHGTITNAVSSRIWPGEAAVDVSMVNWVKGPSEGPHQLIVEGDVFEVKQIPTHLQLHEDVTGTVDIAANADGAIVGLTFATDLFMVQQSSELVADQGLWGKGVMKPLATGTALLTGKLPLAQQYVVYLGHCTTQSEAANVGGRAFGYLKKQLRPHVASVAEQYGGWEARWWQPWRPRPEYFAAAGKLKRLIMCSKVLSRPVFAFVSSAFIPNDTIQVFAFEDDYSFGVIQSDLHWAWTIAKGGKLRSAGMRYTNDVWTTFPWPQEPSLDEVASVADAARNLRRVRESLMSDNGWSLRALYQAAEVAGPHPIKDAHIALNAAVRLAYGVPGEQTETEFLLELNRLVAADESEGRVVQGPGLPRGCNPRDKRWSGTDCIEPLTA